MKLLDDGVLDAEECRQLQEVTAWFDENLPVPNKPYIRNKVTFWFEASAQECIRRMWQVAGLLRAHGLLVEVYKCEHLDYIVYWDQYQVGVQPSRKDGKITIK